jgi:hypothetical protein
MNLQGKCLKREKEKSSWEMREQAWFEYSQSVCVSVTKKREVEFNYIERKMVLTHIPSIQVDANNNLLNQLKEKINIFKKSKFNLL